ncbi:hypothetical protein GCM10023310_51170 [Paenibacillus vulneris]|uniref:YheC/YheD family protein n=1 Tax=Paenibacillus vulneris TaxID=1133364 RepID=A0ABW3UNG3_9BACL
MIKITFISSKWEKTRVVLQDRRLASHVPITRRFSRKLLDEMLNRYRMVYVKPESGSLGIGVMRVDKLKKGYRYQKGVQAFTFPTFQAMYLSLSKHIGKRSYLIQKGIHVLRYRGRPYDFRVVIQKNPAGRWERTGTIARVAHPRKIVSNGSQGGTIFMPRSLLVPAAGKKQTARILADMDRLAYLTAAQFSRAYPAMKELGLDIAIDHRWYPWILEVNTRPDPCPFTKVPDTSMLRKIVAYARAYGKRYRLKCLKAQKAPSSRR